MVNKFFVYGTLRPGQQRWSALESYATDIQPAELTGARLYTVGSWPFVVLDEGAAESVVGEIITVAEKDVAAVTRTLDNIEGFDIDDQERSLFLRATKDIAGQTAYVYVGGHSLRDNALRYKEIVSGDWTKRNA